MTDTTAVTLVALTLLREGKRELARLKPAELEALGARAREVVGSLTAVPLPRPWASHEP